MTKIRILISIAMLLFGFNAMSSEAFVYGNVAIAYGTIELTAGQSFLPATGSVTFPISFSGAPVVTTTGVGSTCTNAIAVASVSPTSVEVQSAINGFGEYCLSGNYIAIGKI